MLYTIYKAQSNCGLMYIGMTKLMLQKRIKGHKDNMHKSNSPFHKKLIEVGLESFSWEVVCQSKNKTNAMALEKMLILEHRAMYGDKLLNYNDGHASSGDRNPLRGTKLSDAQKRAISLSLTGKKQSEHTKRARAVHLVGSKNHNYDHKKRTFFHQVYGTVNATQREMVTRFSLCSGNVSMLCSGKAASHRGWRIVATEVLP